MLQAVNPQLADSGIQKMVSLALRLILVFSCLGIAQAQDDSNSSSPVDRAPVEAAESPGEAQDSKSPQETAKETAAEWEEKTAEEVAKLAKQVDQEPIARTVSAGILQPIYALAEKLAFRSFHWVAFALMVSGVVSYTLQLVLGKLIVLTRLGFSFKEIASDAVGLAISVFGLVLTTQAAAENSTFTQSPFAVISATVVGFIVGVILYFWGQSQELQAAAGRSQVAAHR
ncbi:hypothetical protein [Schlesneria sp.]|uniref:hypothetical protein n=1 Tax=Schlesneria sp. TaxID=2762018 RepID=UPI002EF842EF